MALRSLLRGAPAPRLAVASARRGAAEKLTICDVGPRDGLQNQKKQVSTEDKIGLVKGLYGAGLRYIELTSFVSPKAVPQMADCVEVVAGTADLPDLRAPVLVINEKGYARAKAAGAKAFTVVAVCSDGLAMKNNRQPAAQTIATAAGIARQARADGGYARVALAGAWWCPFDGRVDPGQVMGFVEETMEAGPNELSITDVIGHAQPWEVRSLLTKICDKYPGVVSAHFHDTQALGLSNAVAALEAGVRIFDSSVSGLGGCPFAPGAAGNLATEDLVLLAHKLGFDTGIDLEKLWEVSATTGPMVDKETGGRTKGYWLSRAKA